MLTIWGRKNSINVQKVLWACDELGLDFERIDAGMAFGVNNTPEYKAMNPNGLVPVMKDEGFVLWESHAIVRYLARKQGLDALCPSLPEVAADADRWMDWFATTMWINLRPVFWGLVRTAPEKRDLAGIAKSTEALSANFELLNAHLSHRKYVAGEHFTMGDIPVGVGAFRWYNMDIDRSSLPYLDAWYKRICERPAFQKWCMDPLS
jgi:glutathione S-transferase